MFLAATALWFSAMWHKRSEERTERNDRVPNGPHLVGPPVLVSWFLLYFGGRTCARAVNDARERARLGG